MQTLQQIIAQREGRKNLPFSSKGYGDVSLEKVISLVKPLQAPKIIELGTKQSMVGRSTHRRGIFKNSGVDVSNYILSDFDKGHDVELIADIHKFGEVVPNESVDLIMAYSVYEHLKYPDLCSLNLLKALKVGGYLSIQTHQTFPLHAYPYDYFRFSIEAFEGIFNPLMGCTVVGAQYQYPAVIIPHDPRPVWDTLAESYLNVIILVKKVSTTPDTFQYDI